MRTFLLALTLCLLAPSMADAGENRKLGEIIVAGNSLTNATTATPFAIPPGAYITINCTAAVNVLTDSTVTAASGATQGLPVGANTNFPTTVGRTQALVINNQPSGLVAVFGTGTCGVWIRIGNE